MQTDLDSKAKTTLRRKLLAWFDRHQRDLPWRKNKSPYKTWVSEIMLQQTQVATVIDYFNRFMKRFPTVVDLAKAEQADVLKHWEGLGYYRRARQMHAAANQIVEEHGGTFPTNFEDVLALPGIGRYTAGAILSISLDQRLPILEGNTIRLFARLMGMRDDPRSTSNQKELWAFSESLLPRNRVGDFNQALMETGALICTPSAPKCLLCPLVNFCTARSEGIQDEIPVAGRKMSYESLHEAVVIIEKQSRVLVRQCGANERWAGLWDFPRFEVNGSGSGPKTAAAILIDKVKSDLGLNVELESFGKSIKHAVTKYRIKLDCFRSTAVAGRLKKSNKSPLRWVAPEELSELPLSTTGRTIANRFQTAIKKKGR